MFRIQLVLLLILGGLRSFLQEASTAQAPLVIASTFTALSVDSVKQSPSLSPVIVSGAKQSPAKPAKASPHVIVSTSAALSAHSAKQSPTRAAKQSPSHKGLSASIQPASPCTGDGIYLYQDVSYGGRCQKFTADIQDLQGTGFDDLASSVRLVGRYARTYQVQLCQQAGYGAPCSEFRSNDPDLGDDQVGRSSASSLKLAWKSNCGGDGIYLYDGKNYTGRCWKWTADDADLAGKSFDDSASSIRFVEAYGDGAYEAMLYEGPGYQGARAAFGEDDPDLADNAIGAFSASSLAIRPVPPCTGDGIYLYEYANYAGRCRNLSTGDEDLGDTAFDNIASSVKLAGRYEDGRYAVKLCDQPGYGGDCTTLATGDPDLQGDFVGDDRVSSLQIVDTAPQGWVLDVTYVDQIYVQRRPECSSGRGCYWNDCGPAVVAMVLYYEGKETRNVLTNRQATLDLVCETKSDCRGTTNRTRMLATLRNHGLDAYLVEPPTFDEIKRSIDAGHPVILSFEPRPDHIMLAVGYKPGGIVVVNDPYGGAFWWKHGARTNEPFVGTPQRQGERVEYQYSDLKPLMIYSLFIGSR
jgi:hypothetical protein